MLYCAKLFKRAVSSPTLKLGARGFGTHGKVLVLWVVAIYFPSTVEVLCPRSRSRVSSKLLGLTSRRPQMVFLLTVVLYIWYIMRYLWSVSGQSMVCPWSVHGLSMVYLWSIYGLSYGLSMVYLMFL